MKTLEKICEDTHTVVERAVHAEAMPIDYRIRDKETDELYAEIWGEDGDAIEWECTHPEQLIEFGDDNECGWCPICGQLCNWHWEDRYANDIYGNQILNPDAQIYIDGWHTDVGGGASVISVLASNLIHEREDGGTNE